MQRCVWLAVLGLWAPLTGAAAEGRFSETLRREDFAAAGLAKLSPEELARLDALIAEFKRSVEARAAAEQQKAAASRLAEIKEKLSPRAAVEIEPIETRIKGRFTGWEGKTVFYLENGERWQIANAGASYYTSPVENPRVRIEPASFGGFWMTVVELDVRVRVRPLGKR